MNCNNNYEKALKKIEDDQKCIPKYICCVGATGPQGPSGDGDETCCACINQMRNIIEQIITLYPNNDLFITLDGGDAVVGRAGAIRLGPNGQSGIFEVISPSNTTALVSICSIDSIRINGAIYNDAITYLQDPTVLPTGCCADCDYAVRSELPVGTQNTNIITNTQASSQGNVIRNEYGIIVLENTNDDYIAFVSSCRIDLAYLLNG